MRLKLNAAVAALFEDYNYDTAYSFWLSSSQVKAGTRLTFAPP